MDFLEKRGKKNYHMVPLSASLEPLKYRTVEYRLKRRIHVRAGMAAEIAWR